MATLCFSIYSDISTRIMDSSLPKRASARALDSSVLPTPVGPRNRNDPIGRLGSLRPTRPLLIAFATAVTASSWPITLWCSTFSSLLSLALSDSASFWTGIFVHCDTTSAISSSITATFRSAFFRSKRFRTCSSRFSTASCSLRILDASGMSPSRIASSNSFVSPAIVFSNSITLSGTLNPRRLTFEHASSSTSMALSGRKRSFT